MAPIETPFSDHVARSFDVEKAGRYAALVGLVSYVLGLLIVNMYLFQIGVSDFAVLRTRFILTGTLALLTFAGLELLVFTGRLAVSMFRAGQRMGQGQHTWRARVDAIFEGEVSLFFWTCVLGASLLVPWLRESGSRLQTSLVVRLVTGNDWPLLIAFGILSVLQHSLAKPLVGEAARDFTCRPFWRLGRFLVRAVLYGWFGFIAIDFFASTLYPVIPEQFGGGRPQEVRIVLSPDRSDVGTALDFGPATDSPTVRSVDLLWETEHMYVVRDDTQPNGPIIQIDRDVVSAIVLGSTVASLGTGDATPVVSPAVTP